MLGKSDAFGTLVAQSTAKVPLQRCCTAGKYSHGAALTYQTEVDHTSGQDPLPVLEKAVL
ncbi:hypothetical protein GCM10009530_56920 [Microbispora corallina]|uniref:Uncharacterized protein n=1 Tax=Microbispora corallina TaxID=83302 RepID=A0ABQ4G8U1_9ACTN|nr:hypothetical protein Mco01_64870 [Microbispora corallina]